MRRNVFVGLVVNAEEERWLERLARLDERNRSDVLRRALRAEAERRGLIEVQRQPAEQAA